MTAFVALTPCKLSLCHPRALKTSLWHGQCRVHPSTSLFRGARLPNQPTPALSDESLSVFQTTRAMFSGGGILGVGASEIIVILAVGWFLLGPQKLFSLAKDSGKVIGELRRTAMEARETFTEAMEMDVLAAEAEALANREASSTKTKAETEEEKTAADVVESTPEAVKESNVDQSSIEEAIASSMEAATGASPNAGVSSDFLDQLKRVADPNQIAPSDVPDLSVEEDDEKEFERLEREYFAAKSRLERRKINANTETTSDSTAASDGR